MSARQNHWPPRKGRTRVDWDFLLGVASLAASALLSLFLLGMAAHLGWRVI